jgi:hypothetical protein
MAGGSGSRQQQPGGRGKGAAGMRAKAGTLGVRGKQATKVMSTAHAAAVPGAAGGTVASDDGFECGDDDETQAGLGDGIQQAVGHPAFSPANGRTNEELQSLDPKKVKRILANREVWRTACWFAFQAARCFPSSGKLAAQDACWDQPNACGWLAVTWLLLSMFAWNHSQG